MYQPRKSSRIESRSAGFSLLEVLVAGGIMAIVLAITMPPISEKFADLRIELAATEVHGALQMARLYAARSSVKVAVKFRTGTDGTVTYALYRDGDGDGVRNRDIDDGIDPVERAPHPLAGLGRDVHFGFPPGPAPRKIGGRGRMNRLDDPIRFNRSDLASFSPRGTSTPGTVYLTDGRRRLAAVRVNNLAGKVVILHYDPDEEEWR